MSLLAGPWLGLQSPTLVRAPSHNTHPMGCITPGAGPLPAAPLPENAGRWGGAYKATTAEKEDETQARLERRKDKGPQPWLCTEGYIPLGDDMFEEHVLTP